jgi:hypothetical protein
MDICAGGGAVASHTSGDAVLSNYMDDCTGGTNPAGIM